MVPAEIYRPQRARRQRPPARVVQAVALPVASAGLQRAALDPAAVGPAAVGATGEEDRRPSVS
jgi:hypothetical protein